MLLVGLIMVLQGWPQLAAPTRVPTATVGLLLALAAGAYLHRVVWPLDLPLADRLARTRARAAKARPLQPRVVLAIIAAVVVGSAVSSIGAVLVVAGTGIVGVNLYLLLYAAQLRRRRGPVVWDELAAARELASSLLAATSGHTYRGRFLR